MPSALQSKYMDDAEQFAKANDCLTPVAKLTLAVSGAEDFRLLLWPAEARGRCWFDAITVSAALPRRPSASSIA